MDENRDYATTAAELRANYRPNGLDTMDPLHTFTAPPQRSFDTEEMIGSMQYILAENIGEYVVVEFLIGTERMTRKQGILYHVGRSYVTLYDDISKNFIVCDVFSVKFVYFYLPGDRPKFNYNILPPPSQTNNGNGNNRMR